jgi:hypothetical protein
MPTKWDFWFQGVAGIVRRGVSHRQHPYDGVIAFPQDDQNDGAGTVFDTFLAPLAGFRFPEIRVADNQARPRSRPTHGCQSFNSASR